MRKKLFVAFLSVAFVATSCGKKAGNDNGPGGSEEIELKMNLTKGKKYDMGFVMNTDIEMNMMGQTVNSKTEMTMGMDYEVMEVNTAGNFVIRNTYRNIKASGETMGMKFDFDSETGKSSGMQGEQMATNMKKMIGEYTEMEIDKLGKIIKTTNSPALDEGDKKRKGGMENFNFNTFPDKKIKVGDTWESSIDQEMDKMMVVIKTTHKLVSVKDGIAEISIDGTFSLKEGAPGKITGTQKGTTKIEIATGISRESVIDQDIDMEMDDMGMKMPMKMKNKVTITMK